MTRDLAFAFGTPDSGWLPLRISSGDDEVAVNVSYTPNDFIEELVIAAVSVAEWEGSFSADLHEEPERKIITLTRVDETVTLRVERPGDSRPILSFVGSPASVVLPIWRALRRLEADGRLSEWQRTFPSSAMQQLTELAQRIKAPAA